MAIIKTVTGAINQIMAVDGTTAVLDAIHALAFTKTGGVGGVWPGDSSNFRTLLGAQAPIIAEETTNILSAQTASLEGAGVGNWLEFVGTLSSVAGGYHGSKELQLTCVASVDNRTELRSLVAANTTNTFSCWVRAKNAGAVGLTVKARAYGNSSGYTYGTTVTLTTSWQYITVTKTHTALDTTYRIFAVVCTDVADAGDIISIDAAQIEAKAYATPFALPGATPSRTAGTMTIPTATIGLVPGGAFSAMFVVNTPWAYNDGVSHYLFDNVGTGTNRIFLHKDVDTYLYLNVRDAAGVYKTMCGVATAWTANVTHVIIATISAANVLTLTLDGTALTTANGTGVRESALEANIHIGTLGAVSVPLNGAILAAIWNRVLTSGEIDALSSPATWASVIDLPQIMVTGLATGNTVRLYDSAGNVHASAVETGGTATLTYTLD